MQKYSIIFDGSCGFCNKTIVFFVKKDKYKRFKYISSYSKTGNNLLEKYKIKGLEQKTIIVLSKEGLILTKTKAISFILDRLPGYSLISKLILVPPIGICDFIYDGIAKHRKKIRENSRCDIPNKEIQKRIIL